MRLAPLYQEDREKARQQGKQEGQQLGEQQIILRLLKRRFGELGLSVIEQIQGLSIDELESLGDVLLDFSKVGDLEVWLREKASQQ